MISSLIFAAGLLQAGFKPCLVIAPVSLEVNSETFYREQLRSDWAEFLTNQGYSSIPTDAFLLIVHEKIYSRQDSERKVAVWRDLADGKLQFGDLIAMKDFSGLVDSYYEHLVSEYGYDLDLKDNAEATLGLSRNVILENEEGRRTTVRFDQSGGDLRKRPKVASRNVDFQNGSAIKAAGTRDSISFHFGGWRESYLDRFTASGMAAEIMRHQLAIEKELELEAQLQFDRMISEKYAGLSQGVLRLSAFELEVAKEQLRGRSGDWTKFKVVSSETRPYLFLTFEKGEVNGMKVTRSPVLYFDRVAQRKQSDKPS